MKYCCGVFLIFLVTLSGCRRTVDWGKSNFYQGENVKKHSKVPKEYLRSVVAYNQFMTQAVFDAIWLSDPVRTAYVEAFSARTGKTNEQKNMLLRRELEENNHYISFYVLSLYNILLGDVAGDWSVYLKIDGAVHHPVEIKYVDLTPEYQSFFGKVFNRFKMPYQIKFDAKDVDCNPVINANTRHMQLYFRSIKKEVQLTWKIDDSGEYPILKTISPEPIVRDQRPRREL